MKSLTQLCVIISLTIKKYFEFVTCNFNFKFIFNNLCTVVQVSAVPDITHSSLFSSLASSSKLWPYLNKKYIHLVRYCIYIVSKFTSLYSVQCNLQFVGSISFYHHLGWGSTGVGAGGTLDPGLRKTTIIWMIDLEEML